MKLGLDMILMRLLAAFAVILTSFCFLSCAVAAVSPYSLEGLESSAELIVVGTVTEYRVEVERSKIERAFGNYDWAIYLKIAVDAVEKGELESDQDAIEVRCFRIKSRRSSTEFLTNAGHSAIPSPGPRVRVYLEGSGTNWEPLTPNGVTSDITSDDESFWWCQGFDDSVEMIQVAPPRYTYLLPLDMWIGLLIIICPIGIFVSIFLRRKKQRTALLQN